MDDELTRLRAENAMLKALLAAHGIAIPKQNFNDKASGNRTTDVWSPDAKIKLFRRLFRGRDDVYPVRWESRQTAKTGYSPVCANEWQPGICQKPRIKCGDCNHSLYVPITDDVVFRHLTGDITAGVYPLLPGDRCHFLAIDFDDADWREDSRVVLQTCLMHQLPGTLEISRSGEGAHLWLFFTEPIPARDARQLGTALISATCARTRQLKLSSYDRLFPNQDTMPKGGFGNLIALPLQKYPRELGRSIFLDADLQPHPDQWVFLDGIVPLKPWQLEAALAQLVGDRHPLDIAYAEIPDENADMPWLPVAKSDIKLSGAMPKAVKATMANQIFIEKAGLPQLLMNRLIRLTAFQNPDFYKAQAMRMSTWDKPRVIGCAENFPKHVALPRGYLEDVQSLLAANKISLRLDDARSTNRPIHVNFTGTLRQDQQSALDAMLRHDLGLLVAPTAFGKTVIAAAAIAQRKVSTLVMVHRTELMRQWEERLKSFLALDGEKIGLIGGGKNRPTGCIDVAVIQSLSRRDDLPDLLAQYGQVIIDEAHHLSAQSFEAVLKQANARYVLGLSATQKRSNGHHPIIFMQCGPIRHVAKRPDHVPEKLDVHVRYLKAPPVPDHSGIQEVIRTLANDPQRNQRIAEDTVASLDQGRKVLLLTKRTEHLQLLHEMIKERGYSCFMLHGRMKTKERKAMHDALTRLPANTPHLLLASGQLVGEGLDHAPLDTLILALPVSWEGTLQQYVGRLHRNHAGKTDTRIYDYAELDHPQLARMWDKRQRGYRAMGYQIMSDDDSNKQACLLRI